MDIKNYLKKMEEFKKKLSMENSFSQKEKEILFESMAKMISSDEKNEFQQKGLNEPAKVQIKPPVFESFASLINRAKVSQHMDYILFAAYHLTINESYDNFNVKDINGEYKKAYIKSSNTNVFLVNLVKKGLIMSAGKKEGSTAFVITHDGIKYVEEMLQND